MVTYRLRSDRQTRPSTAGGALGVSGVSVSVPPSSLQHTATKLEQDRERHAILRGFSACAPVFYAI